MISWQQVMLNLPRIHFTAATDERVIDSRLRFFYNIIQVIRIYIFNIIPSSTSKAQLLQKKLKELARYMLHLIDYNDMAVALILMLSILCGRYENGE